MAEPKEPKADGPRRRAVAPGAHRAGSYKERHAAGKALRETCPREAQAAWKRLPSRPDPVQSDVFDEALAAFALAHANRNERDHAAFRRAGRGGKVKAVFEVER